MRIFLLIVFGAAGTLARYALGGVVQFSTGSVFPAGTLVVNLAGCFLLGAIGQFSLDHLAVPPDWRIGITIGFCGGFTTFSTFGLDTITLLRTGDVTQAFSNIVIQVVGGLGGVYAGLLLFERLGPSVR